MDIRWKSAWASIALVSLSILGSACQQDGTAPSTSPSVAKPASHSNGLVAALGSVNGAAGQMPAYYEGQLFTVNMKQQPDPASATIIGQNQSLNEIYASNDLDQVQDFVPVINAIQGEGFNPLWHQNLIVFNEGFTPHQFTSEAEVLAAAAGATPEITLVVTNEVYRCSVVGRK